MTDEEDRGTGSLILFVSGEIVSRSTSLVRRGLNLLREPTEDATLTDDAQAAEQGDAHAQCGRGWDYYFGLSGVPQDYAQAASWFQKAADQGFAKGQVPSGRWVVEETAVST